MKQNILLKTFCIVTCLCSISNKNTVLCMEDNVINDMRNDMRNDNISSVVSRSNIPNLQKSMRWSIEAFKTKYADFLDQFKKICKSVQDVYKLSNEIITTFNKEKSAAIIDLENNVRQQFNKNMSNNYSKNNEALTNQLDTSRKQIASFTIMPNSFNTILIQYNKALIEIDKLVQRNVVTNYKNIINKFNTWNNIVKVEENSEQFTNRMEIKNTISLLQANMTEISARTNNIIKELHEYGNNLLEYLKETVNKINKFDKSQQLGEVSSVCIRNLVINLINSIYSIPCLTFYYPDIFEYPYRNVRQK